MITTTKTPEKEFKLHAVYFLHVDGSEVRETPVLKDRFYVSEQDHNKYGKVEAYVSDSSLREDYYLKQFRGGRPGELLVDPYGMFSKAEDLSAYANQRGHRFCEYSKVPKEVYYSYVNYLETRDVRYFRYCEKFLLDNVK
jgi:hypothetical protein